MTKPPCPCWECNDREAYCHAACSRYGEWKEKITEFNRSHKKRDDIGFLMIRERAKWGAIMRKKKRKR